MAKILPVVLHPHPVLRQKALPVTQITDAVKDTLKSMELTMYAARGLAIAANQVNVLERLVVVDFDLLRKYGPVPAHLSGVVGLINPELSDISKDVFAHDGEGCLSIPTIYTEVDRPKRLTLTFTGIDGQKVTAKLEDLAAACIHHEVDHLDGVLFFDRLSRLRREMVLKKYAKVSAHFDDTLGYEFVR